MNNNVTSFVLLLASVFTLALYAGKQPNVIVILADDMGSADANCYGSKDLETPNIDALAQRGIRFTQFYAASSVCSPSRAGLLTGRFPSRAGVPGNIPPNGSGDMPTEQVTMAEMFKSAGYATAHIGKWHLGHNPESQPNGQGFDYSFGHHCGCIDNYSHFFMWSGPNKHDLYRNGVEVHMPGRFFPDLMVEEAGQFIEAHKAKPFFMYFAINLPHYPYQGDLKWLKYYEKLPYPRNLYAAFVSTMDERIGRLVAHLERCGMRDDTIIVFQSDNGFSSEDRAHYGGGSSGIYRAGKSSLFEGGIRLPGILSFPAKLPSNVIRQQMVHSCDWMPTLAELCGVKLLNPDIDGKSMMPVLLSADAPSAHKVLHWMLGRGSKAQWAVREGDWKLIGHVQDHVTGEKLTEADKKLFLVNIKDNPSETANVAQEHPEKVQSLLKLHEAWGKSF
jgi:arylsulfatase A-like enzyme